MTPLKLFLDIIACGAGAAVDIFIIGTLVLIVVAILGAIQSVPPKHG
jgi:hypothetical protein